MLFSIVIPCYNYAHTVARAINSVLTQWQADVELLVIDDGSNDTSREVLENIAKPFPEKMKIIFKKNGGPASVRNLGIEKTSGQYLLFLDADDALLDNALNTFRELITKNHDAKILWGGHISMLENGKTETHYGKPASNQPAENFKRFIHRTLSLSNGATLFHRSVFETLRYPEQFRNSEDIPVFAQILANQYAASTPTPVMQLYKHPDSLRNNVAAMLNTAQALAEVVFDPKKLPAKLLRYKRRYLAQKQLSISRYLYLAQDYVQSRVFFHRAFRLSPSLCLKKSYLFKYLKS